MEIRELRSFIVIARHENMTKAAEELHVSQSALSKQVKSLEKDLGCSLFERRSFGITLTEEGRLLRERAESLVTLADKIEDEFDVLDSITGGKLYFGLAESCQVKYLAREIKVLRESCPDLEYHVVSGVSEQVLSLLDAGVIDFAVLAETPDGAKYDCVEFPELERWGVIMANDCELAKREAITATDLIGLPLFCSDQSWEGDIPRWARQTMSKLHRAATFGLAYNGAIFAREGLGYLLALDRIVDTSQESGLVFRPLQPPLHTKLYFAWKLDRPLTPIAKKFLTQVKASFTHKVHSAEGKGSKTR